MNLIDTILQRAATFTREHVSKHRTLWRQATVTSVDPIKIQYDQSPAPSPITPKTIATVQVGDRVLVHTANNQTVIHGVVQ